MEISKAKVNKYALLRHKKYRDREGLFIVQGLKSFSDTYSDFNIEAILIRKGNEIDLKLSNVPVYHVSESDMRKISTLDDLPEIIAVYKKPENKSTTTVPIHEFSLVLDGIQDPGNLGTIIRTAHWFGIKKYSVLKIP